MPWHTKQTGEYIRTTREAKDNAVMIYNILSRLGWTLNAISGTLGNVGYESGYNPWRWQSDDVLSINDTYYIQEQTGHAYGLFQFDPAKQYVYSITAQGYPGWGPNFSDFPGNTGDGNAQVLFVHNNVSGGYIPTNNYPLTYAQYKASTQTPEYLALAWLANYERGSGGITNRQDNARYWFDLLPSLVQTKKSKWIYYMKRRRF